MNIIEIKPYETIENQTFNIETKLLLRKENFDNQHFIEGRITFAIIDCDFNKLIIENAEEINFSISISFSGCSIRELFVQEIISVQIDLLFFTSIFSGIIRNNNLRNLSINNCFINNSLFASNISSVNISYTEENVFPRIWKRLLSRLRINRIEKFFKNSQAYYFENISKINFYTHEVTNENPGIKIDRENRIEDYKIKYFLKDSDKHRLSINLSIKYGVSFKDVHTHINNPYLYSFAINGMPKGPVTVENGKIHRIYIHNISPRPQQPPLLQ